MHTYGGAEHKAVENLARQGYEAFCPTYTRPAFGRTPERSLPLFPAYVFVLIVEGHVWRSINSTVGCIRLLTDQHHRRWSATDKDPKPIFINDDFVRSLTGLRLLRTIDPGTVVRVRKKDSPFYDLTGTVVGLGKDQRVWVLMSLFSRDTVVEFDSVDHLEVESWTEEIVPGG